MAKTTTKSKTTETPNKTRGGHNRGQLSEKASGSGPVFQIRTQAGLTQKALSEILECRPQTISENERAGTWPRDARLLRDLKKFAAKKKIVVVEHQPAPEAKEAD